MTKGKKIGGCVFGLILAIVIVFLAWPRDTGHNFTTAVAEKGSVTQAVDLTGNLVYPSTRRAAFLTSGYLQTLHVNLGQTVQAGEVVATLHDMLGAEVQLTAPIAGVVTAIEVYPGEVVSAGMPVLLVSGPVSDFQVLAQASESDVAKLLENDEARLMISALNLEFFGNIVQIAPLATTSQGVVTYALVVSLDRAAVEGKGAWAQLRAGMTVDVGVVTAQANNAVLVPRRAVLTRDGQDYVRVVADNEQGYEERNVTVGLRGDDGDVVILSGIAEGDEVVVKILE